MAKTKNRKHRQQQQSEELEDVMAWGKSKNNYYQDEQDQYSEASQEFQEAQQIYQKQQGMINRDEFYNLPQDQESQQEKQYEEQDEQKGINMQYIQEQILWTVQLGRLFEGVQDQKSSYRKKVVDNYLLILLCLKQFSIPYIQEHPLLQNMQSLRKGLVKLQKQFESIDVFNQEEVQENQKQDLHEEDIDDQEENLNEQEDQLNEQQQQMKSQSFVSENGDFSQQQFEESDDGMKIYEQIKRQKQKVKKQRKAQNAKIREAKIPKQAFKTVKQHESRLASEKIVKNKGLIRKRKKIDGNSRVKLRQKYRKSLIKRKGKGFVGVKANPGRFYEGQNKVSQGRISSTKLK